MKKECDHHWDYWESPRFGGEETHTTNIERCTMPVLIQTRKCSLCGMAQYRRVERHDNED